MGTKTLGIKTFKISFYYQRKTDYTSPEWEEPTRTFKVAPITGSFSTLPGISEAFHYGTKILDVTVGGARLSIPIGQTADMIGAAFMDYDNDYSISSMATGDVVFPGAAESVFIQAYGQFEKRSSILSYSKGAFGTPWPGYLVGFYYSSDVHGPDGTRYDIDQGSLQNSEGMNPFKWIRPMDLGRTHTATQTYEYDDNDRIIKISDGASPTNNYITIDRHSNYVNISTSDLRGWTIYHDANGCITGVESDSGKGNRYFSWSDSLQNGGRVTEVKDHNNNLIYKYEYDNDGDLTKEYRDVDDDGMVELVTEHVNDLYDENIRYRKEYLESGDYRLYQFTYDPDLPNRLSSITSYSALNGSGDAYTTSYTHNVDGTGYGPNEAGNMVLTKVELPDGSRIEYEYDSHIHSSDEDAPAVNAGLRTKATHIKGENALVLYDVDYECFYGGSGNWRLFYQPRIVKVRDGRYTGGFDTEVTYDYENGGADENGDGLKGEDSNQLLSVTGPTITEGYSGTRTPETIYTYDTVKRVLTEKKIAYASGHYRTINYYYDDLLRLTSEIIDLNGEDIENEYFYCDTAETQDRVVRDPEGYVTWTTYDNDGRVSDVYQFLSENSQLSACSLLSGKHYRTQYQYDDNGRLEQRIEDNKDQEGNNFPAPAPATITTEYSYDRLGRLTTQIADKNGIQQTTDYAYTWQDELQSQTDTSGRGVYKTYNSRGLLASEAPLIMGQPDPDNNLKTEYTYDNVGNLNYIKKPTGAQIWNYYDEFSRLQERTRVPGSNGGELINTTFEYDGASNVIRTYVHNGSGTPFSDTTTKYDEGGFNYETRQRKTAGDDGANDRIVQRKFDWSGSITEVRTLADDPADDRIISTYYDTAGRVEKVTDSEGGETTYSPDQRGDVTERTVKLNDTESAVTTTEYDALGRAITVTGPEDEGSIRHDRVYEYDSRGNLLQEIAYDGYVTANTPVRRTIHEYDDLSRQTRQAVMADADDTTVDVTEDRVVDTEYDTDGRVEKTKTYNNYSGTALTTTTTYDNHGRVDKVTDPSDSYTDNEYYDYGLLEKQTINDSMGGSRVISYEYDGHDRIYKQTSKGEGEDSDLVTEYRYDALDRRIWVMDPKDIVTITLYGDLIGSEVRVYEDYAGSIPDPTTRETLYTYNRLGQLVEQRAYNKTNDGNTNLADQETTYCYDSMGRRLRIVYPDSDDSDPMNCTDCIKMTYDYAGRMFTRIDQRGVTTTFTYDQRGNLLTRASDTDGQGGNDVQDSYAYDVLERMTSADRGTPGAPTYISHVERSYTGLGDLEEETQTINNGGTGQSKTVDYDHDQAGNRTGLTYPTHPTNTIDLTYTP
jgi:YD repeat-containing protein